MPESPRGAKRRRGEGTLSRRPLLGGLQLLARYEAMRSAVLMALAEGPRTRAEILRAVRPLLPAALFAAQESIPWHAEWVLFDLQTRGMVERVSGRPLRYRRIARPARARRGS